MLVSPDAAVDRDHLLGILHSKKIGAGVHYRGVHLHPFYRDTYGIEAESLPVAKDLSERSLSLPLSPKVSEADQDDVVAALRSALGGKP